MAIQTINIGSYTNDSTGDDLRTAFQKVNQNFSQLAGEVAIQNATNLGTGQGVFAQKNLANLEFKSLISNNGSVDITSTASVINIESFANLVEDTTPQLGGNLDLNGFSITGTGNIGDNDNNITVNGIKVLDLVGIIDMMLISNTVNLDFGTVNYPTGGSNAYNGINLNLGTFISPSHLLLNFGVII